MSPTETEVWVVYQSPVWGSAVKVKAVCRQAEWDAMERNRPGFYTLVQAGITSDARKLTKPVEFESTTKTGLSNKAGTIAMAALAPGQAQADFFIMTTDITAFDGVAGFAAFGRVTEGMDVVKAILAAPVSATKGEGSMKGQMLEPRITITKAARVGPKN